MSTPFLSFHMLPFQSESIFSRFSGGRMLGFSRSPSEYMECDLWFNVETSCNKKSCGHWCHQAAKRTRLRACCAQVEEEVDLEVPTFSWTFWHSSWKKCDFSLPSTSFFPPKKHANFASKKSSCGQNFTPNSIPRRIPIPMGQSSASPPPQMDHVATVSTVGKLVLYFGAQPLGRCS